MWGWQQHHCGHGEPRWGSGEALRRASRRMTAKTDGTTTGSTRPPTSASACTTRTPSPSSTRSIQLGVTRSMRRRRRRDPIASPKLHFPLVRGPGCSSSPPLTTASNGHGPPRQDGWRGRGCSRGNGELLVWSMGRGRRASASRPRRRQRGGASPSATRGQAHGAVQAHPVFPLTFPTSPPPRHALGVVARASVGALPARNRGGKWRPLLPPTAPDGLESAADAVWRGALRCCRLVRPLGSPVAALLRPTLELVDDAAGSLSPSALLCGGALAAWAVSWAWHRVAPPAATGARRIVFLVAATAASMATLELIMRGATTGGGG